MGQDGGERCSIPLPADRVLSLRPLLFTERPPAMGQESACSLALATQLDSPVGAPADRLMGFVEALLCARVGGVPATGQNKDTGDIQGKPCGGHQAGWEARNGPAEEAGETGGQGTGREEARQGRSPRWDPQAWVWRVEPRPRLRGLWAGSLVPGLGGLGQPLPFSEPQFPPVETGRAGVGALPSPSQSVQREVLRSGAAGPKEVGSAGGGNSPLSRVSQP